jgi:hypothetical protein
MTWQIELPTPSGWSILPVEDWMDTRTLRTTHLNDAQRIDWLRLIRSDHVGPHGIMAQTPQGTESEPGRLSTTYSFMESRSWGIVPSEGIPMQISLEGKIGIWLALAGLAGAGAIMIAPEKLWIGWSLISLAALGSTALGFHHFGRRFAFIFVVTGVLWFDYWYYSNVLNGTSPPPQAQQTPTETQPVPPVSAAPSNPKPKLLSTYQKMIIVCDKPKPEKGLSKKERQEKLDQYVDLMKKVFGYTVKAKTTEDEITLDVTPDKPLGDPTASIVRQAWFVKRAGDQLLVTVTNEYVGLLSLMLAIAQPDAADATMKSIVGQVEKFVSAEQGKCKPI